MQSETRDEREQLGRLIGEVHRLWRARLNDLLRPLGLSQTRWMTLRILSRHPTSMSQVELAARLGVEPPTLVAILDGLTRDDYIERRSCDVDRRTKQVHLTRKARGKVREIELIAAKLRSEVMHDINISALQAAVNTLQQLRERLSPAPQIATRATSKRARNALHAAPP